MDLEERLEVSVDKKDLVLKSTLNGHSTLWLFSPDLSMDYSDLNKTILQQDGMIEQVVDLDSKIKTALIRYGEGLVVASSGITLVHYLSTRLKNYVTNMYYGQNDTAFIDYRQNDTTFINTTFFGAKILISLIIAIWQAKSYQKRSKKTFTKVVYRDSHEDSHWFNNFVDITLKPKPEGKRREKRIETVDYLEKRYVPIKVDCKNFDGLKKRIEMYYLDTKKKIIHMKKKVNECDISTPNIRRGIDNFLKKELNKAATSLGRVNESKDYPIKTNLGISNYIKNGIYAMGSESQSGFYEFPLIFRYKKDNDTLIWYGYIKSCKQGNLELIPLTNGQTKCIMEERSELDMYDEIAELDMYDEITGIDSKLNISQKPKKPKKLYILYIIRLYIEKCLKNKCPSFLRKK